MSIAFRVQRGSGDYVKATVIPANRADQPHFGLLDTTIVALFAVIVGGLIYLLA